MDYETWRCPSCSAVVYQVFVDEFNDIKAIECIVCYERWYLIVQYTSAPKETKTKKQSKPIRPPRKKMATRKITTFTSKGNSGYDDCATPGCNGKTRKINNYKLCTSCRKRMPQNRTPVIRP